MNKKLTLLTVLLIIIASIFTLTLNVRLVKGTTRKVPSFEYPTIQSAVDAAVNGDTIEVSAGTYTENVIITGKSISLIGEDPQETVIRNGQYKSG